MNPTREERETCILVNDLGEITIWTISPTYRRRLTRRLGKPDRTDGDCAYWNRAVGECSFVLPGRRRQRKTPPETAI